MRADPPIVPLARTIPLDVRRTFLRCYRSLAEICWQGRKWTSISQTSPRMRQSLVRILKSCANNVRRRRMTAVPTHTGEFQAIPQRERGSGLRGSGSTASPTVKSPNDGV
jgi:hypothetical protein